MPKSVQRSVLYDAAEKIRALFEEGTPGVVRSIGPLFETAEIFEWIKRAHPPERARVSREKIVALKQSWGLTPDALHEGAPNPGRPAEIYRSGAQMLDPSPYLPSSAHRTFGDWVADAKARLGGEFCMQAPGLECASWDGLERLQALLAPVLRLTGPRTYRYNAFVGDYRRTAFGFHLDPHQEGVFQFVVEGRRRGLFWEGLTLTDDDSTWVEDTNGTTTPAREPEMVIDLEPGDLVFWPGTHLHGFEADGPSMGLSMVIDRISPRRRADVVAGLECATMGGHTSLPGIEDRLPLAADMTVERRSVFSLAYERCDDALIVGVCGRTFDWPDPRSTTSAMRLFDFLREHERFPMRDVIDACADEHLSGDEIREVLTMLANLGFFR